MVSRRDFLKRIALGAVGVAVASQAVEALAPADVVRGTSLVTDGWSSGCIQVGDVLTFGDDPTCYVVTDVAVASDGRTAAFTMHRRIERMPGPPRRVGRGATRIDWDGWDAAEREQLARLEARTDLTPEAREWIRRRRPELVTHNRPQWMWGPVD